MHRLRQVRDRVPARHDPDEGVRADGTVRRARRLPHQVVPVTRTRRPSQLTIQVAPDDCTGCGICVDVCPAKDKTELKRKAINMAPAVEHRDVERERWDFFTEIPELDRASITHDSVKNSQLLQPLFEFSGACSGCGETPYLKLLTQLFGDRLVVANATGCSSIYGGNLPTTPWAKNGNGLGPAWSNSLFEDNAEFGYGMRLGIEHHQREARRLLRGAGRRRRGRTSRPPCSPTPSRPSRRRRAASHGSSILRERLAGSRTASMLRPPSGAPPRHDRRRARAHQHVDRGRRRLGLRHRLRRRRPRARQWTQRQPARARHRGVLQHRRSGVEVDAARCRRQVRDGRQSRPARRTSGRSPAATATCTSPRSRSVAATSRR